MPRICLVLSLLFAIGVVDGFSIATVQSSPLTIYVGRDLSLSCYVVDSTIYVPLEWWGPDNLLISSTDKNQRRFVQKNPNNPIWTELVVRSVQFVDSGPYVCKYNPGVDSAGQILSVSITVRVAQQLTVGDCPDSQWLVNGERERMIRCSVTGDPAPIKYWWYSPETANGNPSADWKMLQSSQKYSYHNNGLQVYNINYNDAGWYRIQATVQSTGESVIIDIHVVVDTFPEVNGPVTFIEPFNLNATGYDLWMQCLGVIGDPKPTMQWFFNNKLDEPLSEALSSRYYFDIITGVLQIKQLSAFDAGKYTCRAANRDGFDDFNFDLVVTIRPEVLLYNNITANLGARVELICDVGGSAPINIVIWKTGDPWQAPRPAPYVLGTQLDDPRISFTVKAHETQPHNRYLAQLVIVDLQPNDTANYSCIASNAGGNYTQNGTIIVNYAPRMDTTLPTIAVGYAGNSTNLTCIAWGNPTPKWYWYRRQAMVNPGMNDTFSTFVEDYGRYTKAILQIKVRYTDEWWIYDRYFCNATIDKYGEAGFEINFQKAQPCEPPTVTVMEVTSNSVVFGLLPPTDTGGTWVTGYQIVYRAMGETWRPAIWFPPEEQIELRFLNANQNYYFRISALNPVGPGKSAEVEFFTLGIRVPYPCIITSPMYSGSPYAYTVSWESVGSGGSKVLEFVVKIRPVTLVDPLGNSTVVQDVLSDWIDYTITALPLMSEFLIRNLMPDMFYQVQVLAQNAYGYSEPAIAVFKTAPPHPDGRAPLLVLAGTSLSPSTFTLFFALLFALFLVRKSLVFNSWLLAEST